MTSADWIKLAIILPIFFGLAPAVGAGIKDHAKAQAYIFAAFCFTTINGLMSAGNWGLTLASVETYRGHAKGYHFYFHHALAIMLITASWLNDRQRFRWAPPGMTLYAVFIVCCTLSIANAPRVDYVLMAAHKMVFFGLTAIAAFHWLTDTARMQFFLKVMGGVMCWEAAVGLKMKYLDGIYQVRGTFEHQNPLAMYAVLIGMPLFAVSLGPAFRGRGWCTAGYISCAILVQSALSRAALLMFAAGTAGVALCSVIERPTQRRFTMLGGLGLVGALGLLLTLDTIVSRFGDKGNTASSELRDVLNEAAREMQKAHPLGVGWNNYALCINTPYPYADIVYEWTRGRGMKVDEDKPNAPVESHYYLLLGENGYAGLVSWLAVMAAGLWRNARAFLSFQHGVERCVSLGLLAGFFLNYVQSSLERVLTQPRNLMLWLILFGLTSRLEVMRRALKVKTPDTLRGPDELPVQPPLAEAAPALACVWPAPVARKAGDTGKTVAFPIPSWAQTA